MGDSNSAGAASEQDVLELGLIPPAIQDLELHFQGETESDNLIPPDPHLINWMETSETAEPIDADEIVNQQVETAFLGSETEWFEDGFESPLSRCLRNVIEMYGTQGMECIMAYFAGGERRTAALAETLRLLGRLEDTATHVHRRWFLERNLSSTDSEVRDAAILGLYELCDPLSAPSIEAAVSTENLPRLRNALEDVASRLRDHRT